MFPIILLSILPFVSTTTIIAAKFLINAKPAVGLIGDIRTFQASGSEYGNEFNQMVEDSSLTEQTKVEKLLGMLAANKIARKRNEKVFYFSSSTKKLLISNSNARTDVLGDSRTFIEQKLEEGAHIGEVVLKLEELFKEFTKSNFIVAYIDDGGVSHIKKYHHEPAYVGSMLYELVNTVGNGWTVEGFCSRNPQHQSFMESGFGVDSTPASSMEAAGQKLEDAMKKCRALVGRAISRGFFGYVITETDACQLDGRTTPMRVQCDLL